MVAVNCSQTLVRLNVDDPLTGKSLTRTFELLAVDAAVRARVVAIAIAELVSASWVELETNPRPRVPAVGPGPPRELAAQAISAARRQQPGLLGGRLTLTGIASAQVFWSSVGALWGGGLRMTGHIRRFVGWTVDALAHHGEVTTQPGKVAVDTVTGAGAVVGRRSWARATLGGGIGFRIGATILRGTANVSALVRSDSVVWAGGGPFGTLGVSVIAVRGLVLELNAEGGYWLFPTGGLINGRRDVAVEGPWLGMQLGVGLAL